MATVISEQSNHHVAKNKHIRHFWKLSISLSKNEKGEQMYVLIMPYTELNKNAFLSQF